MLIHHYDSLTGQYLSSSQPDIDPRNDTRWLIPAFSTTDAPPARTPFTWPFYRDGAWSLLPDYRGRMLYRQSDGLPTELVVAGKTPDEQGLTDQPRPSERYSWHDGGWSVAPEQIAREKHDAAMAEFELRMTRARKQNAGKADALAAGLLDDEGVYYFKAWSTYQMALVREVEKEGFPEGVTWPAEPAPYVPPPPKPTPPTPEPKPDPAPQPDPAAPPKDDTPATPAQPAGPTAPPKNASPDPAASSPAPSRDAAPAAPAGTDPQPAAPAA
jgi:hypothetical protein